MKRLFLSIAFLLFMNHLTWATVTLSSNGDNCIDPASPTTNFSSNTQCTDSGGGRNIGYLVNFDLSSLAGQTIDSARLVIYEPTRGSNHNILISRILQPWVYSTSTWNNYATALAWGTAGALDSGVDFTTTNQSTIANQNPGYIVIDATNLVKDMISNSTSGFLVRSSGGIGLDTFNMRANGTNPPQLMVWTNNDITSNLNVYYKFDEGTGTIANDSSGSSNPGVLNGSATYVGGKIGPYAVGLSGSSQYVKETNLSGISNNSLATNLNSAWSISFWLFPTSSSGSVISSTAIDSGNFDGIWVQWGGCFGGGTAKTICTGMDSSSGASLAVYYNSILPLNTWTQVVITYSGFCSSSNFNIYINGINETTTSINNGGCGSFTNRSWYVGSSATPDTYFTGDVDDYRVYNRALSSGEVTAIFNYTSSKNNGFAHFLN